MGFLSVVCMVRAECVMEEMTEMSYIRQKLDGNWTFNPTISELLTGDNVAATLSKEMVISITEDSMVLEEIPVQNCMMLTENGQKIYMAGTFKTFHIQFGVTSEMIKEKKAQRGR